MTRKETGERRTGADPLDVSACILHVDMDAFFVSVELLDRPELKGEPVIVGGNGTRGVVSSASYEARRFGVRSAMPVAQALRLCPNAIVIPGQMRKYREASAQVMRVFSSITPLVEPLSIDEAFLDVSGARALFGTPAEIAALIRRRVHDETGLTCSVGGGSTKFIAKLASGACKPNGMLIIPEAQTLEFLHGMPVSALWGVGEATHAKLRSRGISTVADLAHTPVESLVRLLGKASGTRLHELAWGIDERQVQTERLEKSISHEQTFSADLAGLDELEVEVRAQADAVAARLRRAGLVAQTVGLKLRWPDFTTLTRSRTLPEATDVGYRIYQEVRALLEEVNPSGRPVRLIGVRAEQLRPADDAVQLTLWDEQSDEHWNQAERTVDAAEAKFGRGVIRPASLLGRGERREGGEGITERPV